MVDAAVRRVRREADKRQASSDSTGVCEGYDWSSGLMLINQQGVTRYMPWVGLPPWEGDTVRISGNPPVCQAVWGSAMGTYQDEADDIARVTGDDGREYRYPTAAGMSFLTGDRVRVDHAGRLILAQYSAEPLGSTYATAGAPPGSSSGRQTFRPIDSGSFRDGVFRGQDVEVNAYRTGVYWYGTQIADSVHGGTILSATIELVELEDYLPGVPSMLGTHTQPTRAGEPSIAGTIPVYDGGVIDISSIAGALGSGAAFGVGFQIDTGYRKFGSLVTSGAITIEWS